MGGPVTGKTGRRPRTREKEIGIAAATTLTDRIRRPEVARRTALVDARGPCSYAELAELAEEWRSATVEAAGGADALAGQRVAWLIPPGRDHVAVQLGVWAGGAIAVPLALSHPLRELEYILDDARPRVVVVDSSLAQGPDLAAAATARGAKALALPPRPPTSPSPPVAGTAADPALIIYTSGTTGAPKGALTTHRNLAAQITALTSAWEWTAADRILHTLPLHHIHGIVNALACALWSGAGCEFGSARPHAIWDRLAAGGITLFMSVPTIYRRLIRSWEEAPAAQRVRWSRGARRLRLMVSGSAALPARTLERWRAITGHTLLERYGMTEIGMALSNPLRGERRAGHVGTPLPGVDLRIVNSSGEPVPTGRSGEIEVRGPQVFREYWGRPDETAAAFRDGWFRTGDEACRDANGVVRILGRSSVDIVNTGGYKVSALEVEEIYRTHPGVSDMAVVGVPHPEWGEQLRAAWVPARGRTGGDAPHQAPVERFQSSAAADRASTEERPPAGARASRAETNVPAATATDSPTLADGNRSTIADAAELRAWGKERLAPYKVPHRFLAVDALPRNAMGKVQKPRLARILMDADADRPPGASGPATGSAHPSSGKSP